MAENHHPPDKNKSFVKNGLCDDISLPSPRSPHSIMFSDTSSTDPLSSRSIDKESLDQSDELTSSHVRNVSQHIDRITDYLSTSDDKSNPPEVPDTVETFAKIIESRISKYNSGVSRSKSCKMTEEDSFFIEAVMRISKLTNAISEFPANSNTSQSLNRTSMVLQRAMAFLEEELRSLLEDSTPQDAAANNSNNNKFLKNSSFKTKNEQLADGSTLQEESDEYFSDDEYPGYSSEIVTKMKRIVSAMIAAGYEKECCQVYTISRRNAFYEQLKKLEYEKINMDDIWRMNWDSLEGEIKRWINVVRSCSGTLFPGEKRLVQFVFASRPALSRGIFTNLARLEVIRLLDFPGAVSMTKRAAEKLFKFLDMHEALRDLIPALTDSCSDDWEEEIKLEISAACDRIGKAAVNIFCDLENSIKSDVAKTPVPGGAVHPLTRYVMNYMKYACEYKETLEQIFEQYEKLEQSAAGGTTVTPKFSHNTTPESDGESPHNSDTEQTPFSKQLVKVMDLLDSNLEAKSRLYRDISLGYVFLMNNGRYILQKVKGSSEIHHVMGDNWCRRRSTVVRQFHKNYQRETWVRLLHILSHEGIQLNGGKINKPLLKERFKNFNTVLEEIHKTQSTWVVSDEQLQSELQVAISAVVIPAYRSFLGRFKQYLESSKQVEKYIKYQPEDIETLIEGLFEGNYSSMARRRT